MLRISCMCFIVALFTADLFAQNNPAGQSSSRENKPVTWKKRIARKVDSRTLLGHDGKIYKNKLADTTLAHLLLSTVLQNKVTAYMGHTADFAEKLTKEKYGEELSACKNPDTVETIINGIFKSEIRDKSYIIRNCTKFKILENWEFSPTTGTMSIDILGIALEYDIYDYLGDYRGAKTLFWLKWADVKDILNKHMQTNPNNYLQRYLWADYFKYTSIVIDTQYSKTWNAKALKNIIVTDTNHLYDGHFTDECLITSIAKYIYDSINNKVLKAYADDFKSVFPFDSIEIKLIPDTILMEYNCWGDMPADGKKVVYHDYIWDEIYHYNLLEDWSFDRTEGKTKIKIIGIQPQFSYLSKEYYKLGKPFWVRYNDIQNALNAFDAHHPLNNFSTAIWQSFFSSTEKEN